MQTAQQAIKIGAFPGHSAQPELGVAAAHARHRHWRWQTDWRWGVALTATVTVLALLTWPGTAPDCIPMLAGWLAAALWCLQWEQRHIGFAVPTALARRLAAGVMGVVFLLAEQRLLKWAGLQLNLLPMLWSLIKGLVSGAVVSLLMPWIFVRTGLAKGVLDWAPVLQSGPISR